MKKLLRRRGLNVELGDVLAPTMKRKETTTQTGGGLSEDPLLLKPFVPYIQKRIEEFLADLKLNKELEK